MRSFYGVPIVLTLLVCTGCLNQVHDEIDECEVNIRNHILAESAWDDVDDLYGDIPHERHFQRGFLDGYKSVAVGGSGCPPTLPPRCYWSVHYQNPEGQAKQQAWFDGYEHGALAAQSDGVAEWSQIVTSIPRYGVTPNEGHVILHESLIVNPDGTIVDPVPPPPPPATDAEDDAAAAADREISIDSAAGGDFGGFVPPNILPE